MDGNVRIPLPESSMHALEVLERAGCEAWCVGGCVRDALRGSPAGDIDIATNAPWQRVESLFQEAGHAVHRTGTDFGTVTVVIDGDTFEVTTFRADGEYRDARHPDQVLFVSTIQEDLARRDFTVNAMAYHPARGLCDPHGGQRDLQQRTVRAVGDARTRFGEDALRILRGMRFSSQLEFEIDAGTLQAMRELAGSLAGISVERVFAELEKALMGPGICAALTECSGILAAAVPELAPLNGCPQNTPYHIYDVLGHTAHVVEQSPATSLSRWAALFHDAGKPACRTVDPDGRDHFKGHARTGAQIAQQALARLKAPRHLARDVECLVLNHERFPGDDRKAVLRELRRLDGRVDLFRALIDLQIADSLSKAPGFTDRLEAAYASRACLDQLLQERAAFTIAQLKIDGNDLKAQGWQPGPALGEMLAELLDRVMAGELSNDRESLLAYALTHTPA